MASASEPAARRPGRPATISREAIADAVAGLPVAEVSMRAVAAKLGVGVPSLYHWVRGRDELLQLAGEAAVARLGTPEDHGQHWSVWLLEWAAHIHRAFVADPGLLAQFGDGTLGLERMLEAIDTALELLVRQGFSDAEALQAFYLISQTAVGASVSENRDRTMDREGHAIEHAYRRLLTRHAPEEMPHLRRLAERDIPLSLDFREQVVTVLVGIAARRGDDWRTVLERVATP